MKKEEKYVKCFKIDKHQRKIVGSVSSVPTIFVPFFQYEELLKGDSVAEHVDYSVATDAYMHPPFYRKQHTSNSSHRSDLLSGRSVEAFASIFSCFHMLFFSFFQYN